MVLPYLFPMDSSPVWILLVTSSDRVNSLGQLQITLSSLGQVMFKSLVNPHHLINVTVDRPCTLDSFLLFDLMYTYFIFNSTIVNLSCFCNVFVSYRRTGA